MEQEQIEKQSQLLQQLLHNPANPGYAAAVYLKQLVTDYPQSGLLQALYACSEDRAALKTVGIYFNSTTLYKLAHAPESLPAVNPEQIIGYIAEEPEAPETTTEAETLEALPPHQEEAQPEAVDHQDSEEQPQSAPAVSAEEENTVTSTDVPTTTESNGQEEVAESVTTPVEMQPEITEDAQEITPQPIAEIAEPEPAATAPENENQPEAESENQSAPEIPATEEPAEEVEFVEGIIPDGTTQGNAAEGEITKETETIGQPVATAQPEESFVLEFAPVVPAEQSDLVQKSTSDWQDDEVFEEIIGIEDIHFEPVNKPLAAAELIAVAETDYNNVSDNEAEVQQPETTQDEQQPEPETATPNQEEQQPEAEEPVSTIENAPEQSPDTTPVPGPSAPEDETVPEGDINEDVPPAMPEEAVEPESAQEDIAPEATDEATESVTETEEPQEQEESTASPEPEVAEQPAPVNNSTANTLPATDDLTDKLIIENISATDYFVFDQAFRARNQPEVAGQPTIAAAPEAPVAEQNGDEAADEVNDLSKYHDEKMPYSFMWWLDKTRREHSGIYQPYAKPEPAPVAEAPQPAYTDSPAYKEIPKEPAPAHQPIEFDMTRKEDKIIQRFIQEEPHIKPPSSDKLGSENKAKKSAEDQDELITETLARIYTDQMLYAKAIATYKKLMLIYPEKSSYFASLAGELEKKIS